MVTRARQHTTKVEQVPDHYGKDRPGYRVGCTCGYEATWIEQLVAEMDATRHRADKHPEAGS